jgi:hypothetical protein
MFRFARRLKTFASARRPPSRRPPRGVTRLRVEVLEDRSVPSSLVTAPLGLQAVAGGATTLAQTAVPITVNAISPPDPIYLKWVSLGGAQGFLGQPVSAELTTPDGIGRFEYYQGGSIYWTASTGADVVKGAILGKWGSLGFEKSLLGYPLTDELPMPDGIGRYNHFQNGTILWYPGAGTFLSFDRNEMLKLFGRLGAGGVVAGNDISTVQGWLSDSLGVWMTDDVRALAKKVVSADPGNANYQFLDPSGNVQVLPLGNLHAGSSGTQLTQLVNKWFWGINEPTLCTSHWGPTRYQPVSPTIPLTVNGFNYYDVKQGGVGDCFLLASLAETAARMPTYLQKPVLQSMFIYDGTNTVNGATVGVWTVRYFHNGATDYGVPDYVTVDTELPAGGYYYADITHANLDGTVSSELWVALAEKAFATYWKGVNSYTGVDSGIATNALAAITGLPTQWFSTNNNDLVNAWNNNKLIVLNAGTPSSPLIVGGHSYALVGYDGTQSLFKVFNPWGIKLTIPGYSNQYSQFDLFTASAAFLVQNLSLAGVAGAVRSPTAEAQGDGSAGWLLGTLPPTHGQPETTTDQIGRAAGEEMRTEQVDEVFAAIPSRLREGQKEQAARWLHDEGPIDLLASDLLFAHEPRFLGPLG